MTEQRMEKIGSVTLNERFYRGSDQYSDGDIEDTLLRIVQENDSYEDVLTREDNWALLYHLSPMRENLLEWYDFGEGKSLLEIGAGCGGVTGLFCRKCGRVVAIDLSRRRSLINAYRNKDAGNLEIMLGNFEDIRLDEKFDFVTLIGVLEYSIYYIDSPSPFVDMLKRARGFLKPGGKLIVAIENKYGIKYWAGAREDHTGNLASSAFGRSRRTAWRRCSVRRAFRHGNSTIPCRTTSCRRRSIRRSACRRRIPSPRTARITTGTATPSSTRRR